MREKSSPAVTVFKEMTFNQWLNPANLLTVLRAALAPPVILLMLYAERYPYSKSYSIAAGLIFLAAALTDKLDGYYARRYDTVTRIGQFLDPLADKLLVIPIMITLWHTGNLPLWVVLVVAGRELLISAIRVVGARRTISFPASWSGKVKMFSQIVLLSILIFFPGSSKDTGVLVLVYLMASITVYSGVDYVIRARREIFAKPQMHSESS